KNTRGRYIGISEPGIIASESPNPTVNELVILPDIEKRLEAFVRMAHCILVFPGGPGTTEEVLYLLGLLMREDNQSVSLPLIFAAPEKAQDYFHHLDSFIRHTLGEDAAKYYSIVIGNPANVARLTLKKINEVVAYRRRVQESYAFNWNLTIPESMQLPFLPTHENMASLNITASLPKAQLISQLRRAFSGIVAGNVKVFGIQQVEKYGPYRIQGDPQLLAAVDKLLQNFIRDGRMKLGQKEYKPCYVLEQRNAA
ncbi:MAG: pyrimidine/purine nucleotide monophosphate nucleosidase domain-containing protein, partial [Pseudohongiellaceae bacterium]